MSEDTDEHIADDDSDELQEQYRIIADKGQDPLRIDKFLLDRVQGTSRSKIQNAARDGNVIVNGTPVKPNYKIKPEDEVVVIMPKPDVEFKLIAEDIPLNIEYEDDHVMIINKQAGLVVYPGYGNFTGTLVNGLLHHLGNLPEKDGAIEGRPGIVHRLDKNTSGLMVVAKTEKAINSLSKQFFERTTSRKYHALVWGTPDPEEGSIEGNIGRSLKNRKVMSVFPEGDYGKHAVTHYKTLKSYGYVSIVECKLETGRTHQIRVHMKYKGHPLFNDPEYGGDRIVKGTAFSKYKQFVENCFKVLPRHALHAKTLGFTHPETKEWMEFDSELPDDIQGCIEKWERYTSGRTLD